MSGAAGGPRTRKRRGAAAGQGDDSAEPTAAAEAPKAASSYATTATAEVPSLHASASPGATAAAVPAAAASAAAADASSHESQAEDGAQSLPGHIRKRPRTAPGTSSPLDALATVELQLVLQWLDTPSKLAAARCSRRLLQAADHPFAWRGGQAFIIDHLKQSQFGTLVSRSLLRHASIALVVSPTRFDRPDLPMAQVALVPRLRELDARRELPPQLLALPALQELQTLRLQCAQGLATLQLLPSLPQLQTLLIDCPPPDGGWRWLPAMPALTDLSLFQYSSLSLIQEAVGQCASLRSLTLFTALSEQPGTFVRFCSTPSMRQLQHFELHYFLGGPPYLSADEWQAGFSQLARLESLRLVQIYEVDLLLPHITHAPRLRTLTIACAPFAPSHSTALRPSRAALLQLLAAAPQLQVRLEMAATLEQWRASPSAQYVVAVPDADEQWRELRRMAAEMDRDRVTIVNVDEKSL